MATRPNPYAARSSARVEQAANIAGIAAAFTEAAALGPGVLALQQAVLEGLGRSQRSEATRIANLLGKDDPRVAAALDRADSFDTLRHDVLEQAEVAGHFVQTFQTDALFHGYVMDAQGTPATGHTVRLALLNAENQKRVTSGTATTDASGYFRIDLKGEPTATDTKPTVGGDTINHVAERIAKALHVDSTGAVDGDGDGASDANPSSAKATTGATETTDDKAPVVVSQVEVLDSSGRVVFEDPQPPTFDVLKSEFRYYVLADKLTATDPKAKR